jgi:hypothetical protein
MAKTVFQPHLLIDIEHWRQRAEDARATAESYSDPLAKRTMFDIAASYDKLADAAERSLERPIPLIEG